MINYCTEKLLSMMFYVICYFYELVYVFSVFFFQAEDGIRDADVTGVQTCALPIYPHFACGRGPQQRQDVSKQTGILGGGSGGYDNRLTFDGSRGGHSPLIGRD